MVCTVAAMKSILGRDVNAHIVTSETLRHLRQYLRDAWNRVTQGRIIRLIRSMHMHCDAVVTSNGGHTRY